MREGDKERERGARASRKEVGSSSARKLICSNCRFITNTEFRMRCALRRRWWWFDCSRSDSGRRLISATSPGESSPLAPAPLLQPSPLRPAALSTPRGGPRLSPLSKPSQPQPQSKQAAPPNSPRSHLAKLARRALQQIHDTAPGTCQPFPAQCTLGCF